MTTSPAFQLRPAPTLAKKGRNTGWIQDFRMAWTRVAVDLIERTAEELRDRLGLGTALGGLRDSGREGRSEDRSKPRWRAAAGSTGRAAATSISARSTE